MSREISVEIDSLRHLYEGLIPHIPCCAAFDRNVVVFPILSGVGFAVRLKEKNKIF
jgi:hypothetical protein